MHLPARTMLTLDSARLWWVGHEEGCNPSDCRVSWGIACDLVCRGHLTRAELRSGGQQLALLKECADAGIRVVVERESMGIKWVRFEKP